MKKIKLTRGQFALVDDEDYEKFSRFKWIACWNKYTRSFYAQRSSEYKRGRKRDAVMMHRQILGLQLNDPRRCDHVNPSRTLDNRKKNLRVCTSSQNAMNRRMRSDNTTGFKGVSRGPKMRKRPGWVSYINAKGKRFHLGIFNSPLAAHRAYKAAAKKYHGEFARWK